MRQGENELNTLLPKTRKLRIWLTQRGHQELGSLVFFWMVLLSW